MAFVESPESLELCRLQRLATTIQEIDPFQLTVRQLAAKGVCFLDILDVLLHRLLPLDYQTELEGIVGQSVLAGRRAELASQRLEVAISRLADAAIPRLEAALAPRPGVAASTMSPAALPTPPKDPPSTSSRSGSISPPKPKS